MSGFSSLSIGVSGLRAAQTALNTTSNNITNAYTDGYVRQITILSDYSYNNTGTVSNLQQIGRGTYVSETSRVRDILLDKAYREQVGREGFYESLYNASSEVETIMGELEGVAFQDDLESFWESLSELAKDPESSVTKTQVVMAAETLLTSAQAVEDELQEYQETLNTAIEDMVDQINDLGDTINELNQQIMEIEAANVEDANSLRDERDLALDQLAELIDISYSENEDGVVSVIAEGVPFVTESTVFHMGTETQNTSDGSTYVTPVWNHIGDENTEVFDLTEEISTAEDNDIGTLKGLLLARGSYAADYTDVPNADDYAGGESDPDYIAAVEEYNTTIDSSIIMKTEALFDNLINGIAETLNDLLSPKTTAPDFTVTTTGIDLTSGTNSSGTDYYTFDAANASPATTIEMNGTTYNVVSVLSTETATGGVPAAGTVYYYTDTQEYAFNAADITGATTGLDITYNYSGVTVCDTENCSVGSDGELPPEELFTRDDTETYIEVTADDGTTYYVYNLYNSSGRESLYTTDNISVNEALLDDCSLLPTTTQDGSADMNLANALVDSWDEDFSALDPNYVTVNTFEGYYEELVYQIGNEGSLYLAMVNSQETTVDSLEASREEVTGVSTDEELTYLIQYQSAYNASSRFITVIDQMLETIVTQL